ncbi:hypothetical protein ACVIJ6_000715 [Bradyrhizobium sp. USDA 4369]
MYGWHRASVPSLSGIRGPSSLSLLERPDGSFRAGGFHGNATLTLSPRLTSIVAACIAAGTLSLGVSIVTIATLSIRALMST